MRRQLINWSVEWVFLVVLFLVFYLTSLLFLSTFRAFFSDTRSLNLVVGSVRNAWLLGWSCWLWLRCLESICLLFSLLGLLPGLSLLPQLSSLLLSFSLLSGLGFLLFSNFVLFDLEDSLLRLLELNLLFLDVFQLILKEIKLSFALGQFTVDPIDVV